jgi:hypothetical protein
MRAHTTIAYVPPPPAPDMQPTKVAAEGDKIVDPDYPNTLVLATVGETIPNPAYNHASQRANLYPPHSELIVALWEAVVENRPAAKDALEIERQAIKVRFPAS